MKTFTAISALFFATMASADCNCVHNNDAGRWVDSQTPASRLIGTCENQGCVDADTQGHMCVEGDTSQCTCLEQAAADWQSDHGDMFLWTSIQCGDLSMTMTA